MDDNARKELLGFLNDWREKHDLRSSEIIRYLIESALHYAPNDTARAKAMVACQQAFDDLTRSRHQDSSPEKGKR